MFEEVIKFAESGKKVLVVCDEGKNKEVVKRIVYEMCDWGESLSKAVDRARLLPIDVQEGEYRGDKRNYFKIYDFRGKSFNVDL